MNVLSLCDGISGGYAASKMAGIKFDKYYSSEINKYANKLSEDNYPDIINIPKSKKRIIEILER